VWQPLGRGSRCRGTLSTAYDGQGPRSIDNIRQFSAWAYLFAYGSLIGPATINVVADGRPDPGALILDAAIAVIGLGQPSDVARAREARFTVFLHRLLVGRVRADVALVGGVRLCRVGRQDADRQGNHLEVLHLTWSRVGNVRPL
jgi:hypothetical protein